MFELFILLFALVVMPWIFPLMIYMFLGGILWMFIDQVFLESRRKSIKNLRKSDIVIMAKGKTVKVDTRGKSDAQISAELERKMEGMNL